MTLPSCPLCREPFFRSRIVKLHVDRPAALEQGVEDVELLQRLVEEVKRQVELEAAVEQSRQRERTLRESLERAQRLQKQREEEAKARKAQLPTVAGKSASFVFAAESEIQVDEFLWISNEPSATVTRTVGAAAPPSTQWEQGEGEGAWRTRRAAISGYTSSLAISAAPARAIRWRRVGGGIWRARRTANSDLSSSLASSAGPPSTRWGREGGGWRTRTDVDLTSPLASSTRAPMDANTFFPFDDGNESP